MQRVQSAARACDALNLPEETACLPYQCFYVACYAENTCLGKHLITLYPVVLTLPPGWLSRSNLQIEGRDVKVEGLVEVHNDCITTHAYGCKP